MTAATPDPGIMATAVQRAGRPETQQIILVAMHFDLSHLVSYGWEFPRVRLVQGPFGAMIVGALIQPTAEAPAAVVPS